MALDRNKFKIMGNSLDVARMWPEKEHPLVVGDSVEGEYVDHLENFGSNASNVYVLHVGDERVGVWGSTVIDENMKDVVIGSLVGFEFAGMRQSKRGNEYKDFRVGVSEAETKEAPTEATPDAEKEAEVRIEDIPF